MEDYEITNNDNDFVRSEDITYWLTNSNDGISFSLEFNKHCAINKFDNVVSKNKKIGGKVIKVWSGLRAFGSEVNEEDDITEPY